MSEKILPFNIDILELTDDLIQGIKPITVLDIFDSATKNFNEDGLFSTSIFGKVGSKDRMRRFSYIQLNTYIFHPIIYKAIIELKSLHEGILKGTEYATFNSATGEFEKSTPVEGSTGYTFFMKHFDKIKFRSTESSRRDLKIDLVEKYKKKCTTNRIVVIPAGLRDFTVDDSGKPTEDQINSVYRKFLSKNNLLSKSILRSSQENLDNIIYSLQDTFNELYEYFKSLLSGKNKLILGKWASRTVYYGTRNVASTTIMKSKDLSDDSNFRVDQTQVGLYQYMKSTLPITMHRLRTGYFQNVFTGDNATANLINKKTFKKETVNLDSYEIEKWLTDNGLEKLITSFSITASRELPIEIMDHYFGLIYRTENHYCVFFDIDEANKEWDRKDIYPITYMELYYLTVFQDVKNHTAVITRHPVTGIGSIYPSYLYLRTTINTIIKKEVDIQNNKETGIIASEYPILDEKYFDTVGVSPVHNARLGLDFDGDQLSFTVLFSEQANAEVKKLLNSTKYYKDFEGKATYSGSYDTVDYVLKNMTS